MRRTYKLVAYVDTDLEKSDILDRLVADPDIPGLWEIVSFEECGGDDE